MYGLNRELCISARVCRNSCFQCDTYSATAPSGEPECIVYVHDGIFAVFSNSVVPTGDMSIAEVMRLILRKKHIQRYARSDFVTNVP